MRSTWPTPETWVSARVMSLSISQDRSWIERWDELIL